MKAFLITLAALLGIAALIVAGLGIRWLIAGPTGAVQQKEQTVGNGSYRIAAYEQFFQDCNSAKTLQQNLANAVTADHAGNVDPMRQAQLDANVTALSNLLNSAVNDYNAHAAETDTRGHFRSSGLPFELSVNPADPTTPAISCTL